MSSNTTPEIEQLKELGRQKKLWCIEVQFKNGPETKRYRLINYTSAQLMNFRNNIFSCGLMYPVDPGRWRIIPPLDILDIEVTKQNKFFD